MDVAHETRSSLHRCAHRFVFGTSFILGLLMMETVVADFKDTVLGILNVYYSSIIRQAENVMPTMICLIFVMRTLHSHLGHSVGLKSFEKLLMKTFIRCITY